MSQYFDENFESVLTMQASRPLGRRVAWLLGILLAVVLGLYWAYDKIVGIDNVKLGG